MRLALQAGSVAAVGARLRAGDPVDARDSSGRTALMLAAARGNLEICRLLLAHGADPAVRDAAGLTAVDIAAHSGFSEGVALLSQHRRAAIDASGATTSGGEAQPIDIERASHVTSASVHDVELDHWGIPPVSDVCAKTDEIGSIAAQPMAATAGNSRISEENPARDKATESTTERPSPQGQGNGVGDRDDDPSGHLGGSPDDSAWEIDHEPTVPDGDATCIESSREVQSKLDERAILDSDTDWSEIDVELPGFLEAVGRLKLDPDLRRWLTAWLRRGLSDGRISTADVRESLLGYDRQASEYESELIRHLVTCIEDAGVFVDAELPPAWSWHAEDDFWDGAIEEPDASDEPLMEESVWRVGSSAAGVSDPFLQWARDIRRAGPLLSREEEISLAQQLRRSVVAGVSAVYRDEVCRAHAMEALRTCLARRAGGESATVDGAEIEDVGRSMQDLDHDAELGADERELPPLEHCLRLAAGSLHPSGGSDPDGMSLLDGWLRRALFGVAQLEALKLQCDRGGAPRPLIQEVDRHIAAASQARGAFAERNLRLVWSIAKRYIHSGMPLTDLVQEGSIGLLRAIDGFDPGRGFRFSTYATWWIRQAVSRAAADKSRLVRVPVHMHERIQELERTARRLSDKLDRPPSPVEIAKEIGWSESDVRKVMRAAVSVVSTDDPANGDWQERIDQSLDRPPSPDELFAAKQCQQWVIQALARIKRKEAMVLAMRAGIGSGDERTLEEVGQSMEVTRERIRQIERKGMTALKRVLEAMHPEFETSDEEQETVAPATTQQFRGLPPVDSRPGISPAAPVESSDRPARDPAEPARQEGSGREVLRVLRVLANPKGQEGLASVLKVKSLQRELARRWFEAYRPGEHGSGFSGLQHAALQDLTMKLRTALRILGFEWIDPKDLQRDESWRMVVESAAVALQMIGEDEQVATACMDE